MSASLIFLIVSGVLLFLTLLIVLTIVGIKLCKQNNGLGIFILFLGLNIFGLVLAISILYNSKNGIYLQENKEKEQKY